MGPSVARPIDEAQLVKLTYTASATTLALKATPPAGTTRAIDAPACKLNSRTGARASSSSSRLWRLVRRPLAAAKQMMHDSAGAAPLLPSNSNYRRLLLLTAMGRRYHQQLACADTDQQPGCMTKCDARCPNQCIVICPGCKTYCICDLYPGMSCGDPHFTGGDGNSFYFHGARDKDFCIVSDAHLHVNAHFIGKPNPNPTMRRRDFTWIQALGITFSTDHRLYVGARKTARWDSDVDRLDLALDGDRIDIPTEAGAAWESVPGLTVTRTAATNGVRVQLRGVLDVVANVVPVTAEDSRVHGYGVTMTDDDCLAHLDLGFSFHGLTDDVHGVLGQTYRPNYYVNRFHGVMPDYVASDIFATDCAVTRFRSRQPAAGIVVSMLTPTIRAY
ncbi:hypothetical protein HU200_067453 [Digitaria exilis]|uniref:Uncharacterized protein n=1 Tax=Digitaria exilis TaxID=1010633 RepID=A0A835A636_9POAL|nr:hypothetical protein HU200_067453 [Digitaria exilis]